MAKEQLSLVCVTENDGPESSEPTLYYQKREVYFKEYDPSCLQRCSNRIITALEKSFYRLGLTVARRPIVTIIICLLVCGLCGIGFTKFKSTTDDAKLWVPQTSRVLPEKEWVNKNFPEEYRFTSIIITARNIISPAVINAMYDMYLQSRMMKLVNLQSLDTMCVKVGPLCKISSILELWKFNGTLIRKLTTQDVLDAVNAKIKYSPSFGTEFNLDYMLGGIRRDDRGNIIGADSVTMLWVLHKKPEWEKAALEFERQMIKMSRSSRPYILKSYVYATRTFDDEGYGAVKADTSLLTAGFIIVFVFVILVLGKFNMVENKLYVSLIGIFTIGLAIMFCYGIAMGCGLIYGPIHNLMPFLLLGIGVDDMFVIVGAWKNLSDKEKELSVPEKIAMTLKHAGVSITVTSITDIVAFGIGSTTVIPALSAFCAYAAIGILGLYILASTFFVAVLTLDEYRISDSRNSVLCCYKHKDYSPTECSKKELVAEFIKKLYAPVLMKLPSKVIVVVITGILVCVNSWSFSQLEQDFDLYDYIPTDSYATDYIHAQMMYYPDRGYDAAVYCGDMDYYENRHKLEQMYNLMRDDPYIQNGSINFWYPAFINYIRSTQDYNVSLYMDSSGYPASSEEFNYLLTYFLRHREGRSFGQFIKFNNINNETTPSIKATYIPVIHTRQSSSAGDIEAMESLRNILDNAGFINGSCFSYGFKYLNNETNKVLKGELYRNLALAGVCVFVVTLLLIANLWTSILVFSCVLFTVIDVTGTLQFWGVTIDTASSILIILCVGLAVDYSAHIGHMFMTILGSREDRAKATLYSIGPAVWSGGVSTFLAFVLLANSKSYGFVMFFRVFMTVVLFGLFHGLVYLPVVLSWVGPSPYPSLKPRTGELTDDDPFSKRQKNSRSVISKGNGFLKVTGDNVVDASTQVQMDRLNNESPLSDDQGHSSVSQGHGHLNADFTDASNSMQPSNELEIVQGQVGTSIKVKDFKNDLDIVKVEKCSHCERQCVMCVLNKAQHKIQTALQELNQGSMNDGATNTYCSCEDHKHICSHNCT